MPSVLSKLDLKGIDVPKILRLIFLTILNCLFVVLPNSASATNYYVDNVGGSNTNSGTSTSMAWKTIAGVNSKMSQLVAGDIVSFKRGGTWTDMLTISKSGVSGNPITFNAYGTGNKPIIRNPSIEAGRKKAIYLTASYIVIDDLMVRDAVGYGIDVTGSHNVIRNSEITNVGVGVTVQGKYNLVTQNYVHDLIMVKNTPTPTTDDYGCQAVALFNTDNEVSYNKVENCRTECYDYGWAGRVVELFGQVSRSYIHHNWSYHNQGFLEAGAASNVTISDVRVEYNVTLDAGRFTGINNSPGDYQVTPDNFMVQNNTIVETASSPVTGKLCGILFDAVGKSGQYIFRNNILYLDGYRYVAWNWTTFTHDHNLFYLINGTQLNITKHSTEITGGDPQFVSLSTKNLRLKSDSPARDKGVDLGYSGTVDFDGNSVPFGPSPDIGAYEYIGAGTPLSANASASPTSGQAPLTVGFTSSATGGTSPYSYRWTFGDGGSSTTQNASHTYSSAGTYTVTLTVTDSLSATASKSLTITVTSTTLPLAATASASPTSGQAPLTVSFTGSATGGTSPYSYTWTFGDGGTSTTQNPGHVYSTLGGYIATLTVTDNLSARADAIIDISVVSDTTAVLGLSAKTGAPAPGKGGTTDPTPGNHSFSIGSAVDVDSIPNTDYRLSKWTGDVLEASMFNVATTVALDKSKSLLATFCTKCADVNGDLKITPSDAQLAFDLYLGKIASPTWCELENADVNCSGTKLIPKITPADAQIIFNKYLKKGTDSGDCSGNSRAAVSSQQNTMFSNASLTIDSSFLTSEGDILIPIIIESPSEIGAFGLDLAFPSDSWTYVGLEGTDLTSHFDQLAGNVVSYQASGPDQSAATIPNDQFLRVGGYKTSDDKNASVGVLVTLVFRAKIGFVDPSEISIIAAYDDIQIASIYAGSSIRLRENERRAENRRPADQHSEDNERKNRDK